MVIFLVYTLSRKQQREIKMFGKILDAIEDRKLRKRRIKLGARFVKLNQEIASRRLDIQRMVKERDAIYKEIEPYLENSSQ